MIYKEAVKAMKERKQVKSNGIVYKRINAIIFRKTDYVEVIEVELQDKNNDNSVTVTKLERVDLYETDRQI